MSITFENVRKLNLLLTGTITENFSIGKVCFFEEEYLCFKECKNKSEAKKLKSLLRRVISTITWKIEVVEKDKKVFVIVYEKNAKLSRFKLEFIVEYAIFENISPQTT